MVLFAHTSPSHFLASLSKMAAYSWLMMDFFFTGSSIPSSLNINLVSALMRTNSSPNFLPHLAVSSPSPLRSRPLSIIKAVHCLPTALASRAAVTAESIPPVTDTITRRSPMVSRSWSMVVWAKSAIDQSPTQLQVIFRKLSRHFLPIPPASASTEREVPSPTSSVGQPNSFSQGTLSLESAWTSSPAPVTITP